jgi:hypothetical protein
MSSIAITVGGVLRRPKGGAPIQQGIDLYFGLATRAKLVLLSSEQDHTGLEYWLRAEGMNEHAKIIWSNVVRATLTPGGERLDQLGEAAKIGHDVTLVIEPDPEVSKRLIISGYNVLTFTHAEYSVPAWRPDAITEVRAWDELSEQVAREAYLRATDPRRDDAETAGRHP